MTYDHTRHLAARMKPKQHKVELEISLDVGAKTYSESRGRHIAETVDGDRSKENTFHGPMMDRSLLSSVRATENSGKYVAGIFSDGVLHLTPVEGVIQLRPTFNYFDQADEVNKKNMKARQEDGNSSQSEDELMDAKPVQLRFSKAPQADNKKQAKEGQQEEDIDEMWLDMRYYQPQDTLSLNERNRLYCRHDDFEAPELTSTTRDYIKALQPQVVEEGVSTAAMPHGVISLTSLKKMELKDQIKALLLNAKVVQLRQICSLLSYTLDERVIISGLRQYARLVQGCWVVRSELLYPAGMNMPGSGVQAEKMWPSRDYILFCFNRKRLLTRKEIISSTKLPPEDLREMLEQMARQRPARGWEFLLPTDDEFLKRHQDIANEEYELWAARYKELAEELQLSEDNLKEVEMPGLKPKSPQRRRRNSNSFTEDPKKIGRRRRSSQSSQGGSDGEPQTNGKLTKNIKKEHSSPSKMTASQQLGNNTHQTSTATPSTLTPTYSRTDSLKGIIKTEATSSADEK
jgi:DNA-directed RNA polymerase-3 subunit RPC5